MNLLIDAHVFDGPHQGSRTYLKGLYSELISRMPGTSFFFAAYNLPVLRAELGDHPNVHFVQLKQSKIFRLLFEFPVIIRKHKIDYAHFQYVSPPYKNCKQIITTHDILFKDFKQYFPLKYRVLNNLMFYVSAKRANILLTVSEYSRQRIAHHYAIPVEKIGVTPNGISSEFFTPANPTKSNGLKLKYGLDNFILYVSRIEPRKNHLLLLRAFSELRLWENNFKLVFIGKKDFSYGDLDHFLKNCSEECRAGTLLLHNIDDTELLAFYKNANLFVYPSLAEGFGIPPIEAISAGTATLCSNATAMSDFVFLGDDLFNPSDIHELKAKILNKIQTNTSEHTDALKKIVSEKYSWSQAAINFISSLKDSVSQVSL